MIDAKAPLDLVVQITTPENIRFEYRLAGPFRRFQAMVLDVMIRVIALVTISIAIFLVAGFLGFSGFGNVIAAFATAFILILWFAFEWFYGLFFESWMNGQTPAKRILGLRVISIDGRPINAVQATIRNFLRVADIAPVISLEIFSPEMPPAYMIPTFVFALISMVLTRRMQRLGDLAAGTMVVIDEKNWYPKYAKFDDPRVASLAEFIPAEFRLSRTMAQAIALYCDRRIMFSPARRAELAAHLATPLHQRFGFRADTSADLTLCALYHRNFVAGESRDMQLGEERPSPKIPTGSATPFLQSTASSPLASNESQAASLPPSVTPVIVDQPDPERTDVPSSSSMESSRENG